MSVGDPGRRPSLYEVVLTSQRPGALRRCRRRAPIDRGRATGSRSGWGDALAFDGSRTLGDPRGPRVAATADTLLVGDVVTVEPGVYLPGIGGVRIEDMAVVTATGSEPLTLTPDLVL